MKLLVITPQLGFEPDGSVIPGGLQNFSRCVARVLASTPQITHFGVWAQVDSPECTAFVRKMVDVYAHSHLVLDVRCFGGSKIKMAAAVVQSNLLHQYDHVMYLLVNQSVMAFLPGHPPYSVWEIGEELFHPVSSLRFRAMMGADRLFSISHSTSRIARETNPGLPDSTVIHLCVEPPLYELPGEQDPITCLPYDPSDRQPAVVILARMDINHLYKGHQQLIAAWSQVVSSVPDAELWIIGDGSARNLLEDEVAALPQSTAQQVHFLGRLGETEVDQRFRKARVFAMPSTKEGFGLVFVEAARYGIPCIGGKHDSVKEIVLHEHTGLLVEQNPDEIARACITLLTNNTLAAEYGEAGRQRYLDYFQFEHFRQRLLDTLEFEV